MWKLEELERQGKCEVKDNKRFLKKRKKGKRKF
jgi:hypothetical protein